MKRLIVNADDFGLCASVNQGIVEAHRNGIVTSATLLASAPGFEDAVALARETPTLRVGVHLNLTRGRPLSPPAEVPSLVRDDGAFAHGAWGLPFGLARRRVALGDVRREWAAQVTRVRGAGLAPTHLDSEKHVHLLPPLLEAAIRLAESEGILALRAGAEPGLWPCLAPGNPQWYKAAIIAVLGRRARRRAAMAGLRGPDRLLGILDGGRLEGHRLPHLLRRIGGGVTELICHPGYDSAELRRVASESGRRYRPAGREREVEALTAPGLRQELAAAGIELIHYGML